MRPVWIVRGYGRMPISGEYTQRVQDVPRAFTAAGAIRRASRPHYVRYMGLDLWEVERWVKGATIRGGPRHE